MNFEDYVNGAKKSYLIFDHRGVSVDVERFISTTSGMEKFMAVAKSAFPNKYALSEIAHSPKISKELLGKIIDEVFDGAIEDVTVIEDIYRVIYEHEVTVRGPHRKAK